MRVLVVLVLSASLVSLLPSPSIEAAGLIAPTLYGPTLVPAARNWTYTGQLQVAASGTPVFLADQPIGLHVNGSRVTEGLTKVDGTWLAHHSFSVGVHTVQARAFEGEPYEGTSSVLTVHAFPTWPAGPSAITVVEGYYWNQSNVSWNRPWTDGGYPVLQYDFARSHNGGPYVPIYSGLERSFTDFDTVPGHQYVYRGTATTAYAQSNATVKGFTANMSIATIEVVGFQLCDVSNCSFIPDGGVFNTSVVANVTVEVRAQGVVDDHPVAPPAIPDRPVYGYVALPEVGRGFFRETNATGGYAANPGELWAHAPAGGCEEVTVVAQAQTDYMGRTEDTGSFFLCV